MGDVARERGGGAALQRGGAAVRRRLLEVPEVGLRCAGGGDLDRELEAVLAFLHPEAEYNAVPAVLWGGTARGHLDWLRSWDAFLGASEEFNVTVNEVTDLGGDEVLVAGETTAKWKGSGMRLSEPRFVVVSVREGSIVRLNAYRDRAEALDAAGLSAVGVGRSA